MRPDGRSGPTLAGRNPRKQKAAVRDPPVSPCNRPGEKPKARRGAALIARDPLAVKIVIEKPNRPSPSGMGPGVTMPFGLL
jgi:hypothetical protein